MKITTTIIINNKTKKKKTVFMYCCRKKNQSVMPTRVCFTRIYASAYGNLHHYIIRKLVNCIATVVVLPIVLVSISPPPHRAAGSSKVFQRTVSYDLFSLNWLYRCLPALICTFFQFIFRGQIQLIFFVGLELQKLPFLFDARVPNPDTHMAIWHIEVPAVVRKTRIIFRWRTDDETRKKKYATQYL